MNNELELILWIRKLEQANELWRFYKSSEFRSLRRKVLEQHHYECYNCRARGKIVKAQEVHHVFKVREYPQYALSEFVEIDGELKRNLIPLCRDCHNKEHRRLNHKPRATLNEERW